MRFVSRDSSSDCWEWTGYKNRQGYGRFWFIPRGNTVAHRASYEIFNNVYPDKNYVLHTCDNKSCVNPAHLYLGDHKQNMADRQARSRHRNTKKSHCPSGHILSGDNLYQWIGKTGKLWRQCKTCRIKHLEKRDAKRKGLTYET